MYGCVHQFLMLPNFTLQSEEYISDKEIFSEPRQEMEEVERSNEGKKEQRKVAVSKVKTRIIHVKPVQEITSNYGRFLIENSNTDVCVGKTISLTDSKGDLKQTEERTRCQTADKTTWQTTAFAGVDKKGSTKMPNVN